ncbi:hypothetical protein Sste5346_003390 [Sporothrix stenoceras]|uniref:Major facilitator superfamily (MFS) profile domain-containing protein n=1 Tax=Sporothrix stenoceras TaxID=5173 RepID=A0ABR3ZE12_9PEZI
MSGQTNSPSPSLEVKDKPLGTDNTLLQQDGVRYVEAAGNGNGEPEPRVTLRSWLALLAADLAYFAQLINLLGAGVQAKTIATHLGNPDQGAWFTATITIFTVVLAPIFAQGADYWGRKWLLTILLLFGVVGSIIVSRSTSVNMAIAGFSINGISNAGQPIFHTIASEVMPRKWRGYAQASSFSAVALGSVTGLLLGAGLNRTNNPLSNGFRTYFYIATGIYFVSAVLVVFTYYPSKTVKQRELKGQGEDSIMAKLAKLDWVGYILIAAGIVLFSLGLTWAKNPYPWSDPHVAVTFALGLFFLACLVVYETWFKKDGLFHHDLFTRNFAIACYCIFAEGLAFIASNSYFSYEVLTLYQHNALLVSTDYSIGFLTAMLAAILTGVYCSIVKDVKWITVAAFVIFTAFFAGMAALERTTAHSVVWGLPVLLGAGLGIILNVVVVLAQMSTPPHLIAAATGLIMSLRSLGGTVGLAIHQALLSDELGKLPVRVADVAIAKGLPESSVSAFVGAILGGNQTALASISGVTTDIITAGTNAKLDTYVLGFRYIWIAAAAFVALAAILSLFIRDLKSEFNMHIDAPVERKTSLTDGESI